MGGATSSAAGSAGLVPAPTAGKQTSFLRGDGTWVVPTNTTYAKANTTTLGLVMIGYTENGKNYPVELDSSGKMYVNVPWTDTNTTYGVVGANGSTGLVKNGSTVTSASGYTACPIVGGIPYYKDTNTTYANMKAATVFLSAAAINPLVDSLATAYVVLGGVAQVPSPRMKLDVLPLSCLNKPLAVVEANPYVVLVGTTHVPSPRRKDVCLPAAGAGTNPAAPAAETVAAFILA